MFIFKITIKKVKESSKMNTTGMLSLGNPEVF